MSVNFEEQYRKPTYSPNQSFAIRTLTKLHMSEEQAQKSLIFIFVGVIVLIVFTYVMFIRSETPEYFDDIDIYPSDDSMQMPEL